MSKFKSPPKGNSSKQDQMQVQNQKQISDQNYANYSIFMALSTLESLQIAFDKSNIKFEDKRFGYYDKHDYSSKTIMELKEQLQTQLMGLQVSRKSWQKNYEINSFVLPKTFNQDRLKKELQGFKAFFKGKDKDCYEMIKDLQSIFLQENRSLYIHQIDFSQHGKNCNIKQADFVKNVNYAADQARQLKRKTEQMGICDPRDLPTHIKQSYGGQKQVKEKGLFDRIFGN